MSALEDLVAVLRAEDSPLSAHLLDPPLDESTHGEYALLFESIREGYLLHYERPRLLAGHDEDLALLAGDYLYALGLARLAAYGDDQAVGLLAGLIGECARLHAEERGAEAAALWDRAAEQLGLEPS